MVHQALRAVQQPGRCCPRRLGAETAAARVPEACSGTPGAQTAPCIAGHLLSSQQALPHFWGSKQAHRQLEPQLNTPAQPTFFRSSRAARPSAFLSAANAATMVALSRSRTELAERTRLPMGPRLLLPAQHGWQLALIEWLRAVHPPLKLPSVSASCWLLRPLLAVSCYQPAIRSTHKATQSHPRCPLACTISSTHCSLVHQWPPQHTPLPGTRRSSEMPSRSRCTWRMGLQSMGSA